MSEENVENVRAGYEQFAATGDIGAVTADFVWDVSNLHWPDQQVYEGAEGARTFIRQWADAWEDWQIEVDALHDAGDRVVVLVRQRGRSKTTGMPLEMHFAQVWTFRDGKAARMEMYSDPAEALEAAGLQQ